MTKTNLYLIWVFLSFFSFPLNAQLDSVVYQSAFAKFTEAKVCYEQNGKSSICAEMMKEAYRLSDYHAYFMEEILASLISFDAYEHTGPFLQSNRLDTLTNSQKARLHYFKGLLDLRNGFYRLTPAHQSFKNAYFFELRSSVPSFHLLSQIQNAIGHSRMIYGGPNLNGNEDYPHSNWMTSDLLQSLQNFNQAIYFDKENPYAIANRDTIISKIKQAGTWKDEFEFSVQARPFELLRDDLLIQEKSDNDTLDLLDVNLLPNNKEVLLKTLQKYDELLLAVDISGSMDDIHSNKGVTRFRLMRELVLFLFRRLLSSTQMGIVSVGGECRHNPKLYFPVEMNARRDIMEGLKELHPYGNTPLIYSLSRGKELYTTKENRKALFLVSDGMERCGPPLDLCILASDLYAMGVDLHIISFIVQGMEDAEFAYEIYSCMTRYSNGQIFRYDEIQQEPPIDPKPVHREKLLLPPIRYGDNFRGVLHFEVNLSEYFSNSEGKK